jgi:molybdenum-dependent DNA-binding transcriptional regulator ModE
MSGNADLDKRAAEALLRYRAALARVEALEQDEAVAHRALVEWRSLVENSNLDGGGSAGRSNLAEAGQNAISRLHDIRVAMSEATAELKSALTTLVAFDDALGYLPFPEATKSNVEGAGGSAED